MPKHQNPNEQRDLLVESEDQAIHPAVREARGFVPMLSDLYALAAYYVSELYEIERLWRLHGLAGHHRDEAIAYAALKRIKEYLGSKELDEVLRSVHKAEEMTRAREDEYLARHGGPDHERLELPL